MHITFQYKPYINSTVISSRVFSWIFCIDLHLLFIGKFDSTVPSREIPLAHKGMDTLSRNLNAKVYNQAFTANVNCWNMPGFIVPDKLPMERNLLDVSFMTIILLKVSKTNLPFWYLRFGRNPLIVIFVDHYHFSFNCFDKYK